MRSANGTRVTLGDMMKKIISYIAMFLIFCTPSHAEIRKADYREIKSVYFFISKSLGSINSYAIFVDGNNNQCAVAGSLSLSKEVIDYKTETIIEFGQPMREIKVPQKGAELLKKIEFNENDFQYLKLRAGDTIYALPIELDPSKIKEGDIIILEWYSFKVEERVL